MADLAGDEDRAGGETEVRVDMIGRGAEDRPDAAEAAGLLAVGGVEQAAGGEEVVALAVALGSEVDVRALGTRQLEVDRLHVGRAGQRRERESGGGEQRGDEEADSHGCRSYGATAAVSSGAGLIRTNREDDPKSTLRSSDAEPRLREASRVRLPPRTDLLLGLGVAALELAEALGYPLLPYA